ncbi:hypothetical protein CAMRE0001_2749 [Campylobacter rectus RM3267]|uniref:Uncharacterized protein n=1 Tax=Campylobacter rectus RM3267 TaxID=553218 RepID=B9D0V0_CAMRE|nr:hypothetical protein CAMRE0001_2749 [Campylobacter rectus RM3267]
MEFVLPHPIAPPFYINVCETAFLQLNFSLQGLIIRSNFALTFGSPVSNFIRQILPSI